MTASGAAAATTKNTRSQPPIAWRWRAVPERGLGGSAGGGEEEGGEEFTGAPTKL
jgi:hypothetical protein